MNYGTHQPHVSPSTMRMFGPHHLAAHVSGVSHFNPAPPFTGLRGLGDWFSDGVKAVAEAGNSIFNTITGTAAQQDAQRNAIAIQQIEAQRAVAESAATAKMVVGGAVAVGVLGLVALVVLKR